MASMSMPQQLSPIKQEPDTQARLEPHVKHESSGQPGLPQSYHAQQPFYQQQGQAYSTPGHQYSQQNQSYSNFQQHPIPTSSSPTGSVSFSSMSSTSNYNLPRHLMSVNMHQGTVVSSSPSSTVIGSSSAAGSSTGTPVMANAHLNPNGLSSAPSSPIPNTIQYHPSGTGSQFNSNVNSNNNSGSNSPYIQHQTYQPSYAHQQNNHTNDLNTNGYYNPSPPYGSQHGSGNSSGNQFNSTAPSPMRQHQQSQYTSLVPPLPDSQYAQYHQLLGSSAFSSSQSTPYHSNHSTPYSSMPGSPTREFQQVNDKQLNKPKRRQVKNACVNCQRACKKCDEGRPCARCIKYGLTDTCVDSTRKVRKKGIKRGPYKRRPPPSQTGGSASASTTPTLRNAVPSGVPGYMSEPVTALNSPTQSHMPPFTTTSGAPIDFGYDTSGGPGGYPFHSQRVESGYSSSSYTTGYSGSNLFSTSSYGINSGTNTNIS